MNEKYCLQPYQQSQNLSSFIRNLIACENSFRRSLGYWHDSDSNFFRVSGAETEEYSLRVIRVRLAASHINWLCQYEMTEQNKIFFVYTIEVLQFSSYWLFKILSIYNMKMGHCHSLCISININMMKWFTHTLLELKI